MRAREVNIDELRDGDKQGRLFNSDLAPASPSDRQWSAYSLFSLWMNDAHNASNYTFAAGLFIGTGVISGMTPMAIVVGVLIATVIIFIACSISGRMGYETGAPYPVISRITWGVWGANFPALIRCVVAIAWYGIQTYLASISLELLLMRIFPPMQHWGGSLLGLRASGWLAFLLLSAIQLVIVWRGMDAVRHFQGAAGPIIWVIMIGLGVWMLSQAHWKFSWLTNANGVTPSAGTQTYQIFVAVGLTVGTLATLMLNFSDFARYAPSRKSVFRGNLFGLPLNWTAFALTAVLCSSTALQVYGEAIHDPGDLLAKIDNNFMFYVVSIGFIVATVGVNIVANFVSAAFDLSNVNPKRISFRVGGIIAVVTSVVVTPWNIYGSPAAINYFLGTLGSLLGPFFGILVLDYYYYKRSRCDLRELYSAASGGRYYYRHGWNMNAVIGFIPAATISMCIALVPAFSEIAPFSWFIAAPLGALSYWITMRARKQSADAPLTDAEKAAEAEREAGRSLTLGA